MNSNLKLHKKLQYQNSVNITIITDNKFPQDHPLKAAKMEENSRQFGVDIQNIVNNNHIVLRASSFSFKDKNKIYAGHESINVVRRQSMLGYHPKTCVGSELIRRQNTSEVLIKKASFIEPVMMSERQSFIQPKNESYLQNLTGDNQYVPEYVKSCIDHLISQQSKKKIKVEEIKLNNPHYIKNRSDLLDWISRVHSQLKLFQQTFTITINYIDRYLSKQKVQEKQLDHIALVCLLIAGKYQQVYNAPNIKSIIQISRLKLQAHKIMQIEEKILSTLQFELISDSPIKYIQLFSKIVNLSKKNQCIVQYFLQMCLLDSSFIQFSPSKLASSALFLMHRIRRISPAWPSTLKQLTGYSQPDLNTCAKMICKLMEKQNNQFGFNIRRKFSKPQYCCASTIRICKKVEQS